MEYLDLCDLISKEISFFLKYVFCDKNVLDFIREDVFENLENSDFRGILLLVEEIDDFPIKEKFQNFIGDLGDLMSTL